MMDAEWQRGIEKNPLYASSMGILNNNDKWPTYSLEQIELDNLHNKKILDQLNNFDVNSFQNSDNLLNFELFKKQYIDSIEAHKYKNFLIPFSHRGGIQLQHESAETLPLRNISHYVY
jgi:uncharacterized protein (DUF885 family)